MINQILQDSLSVNQADKYHSTHLSLDEVEDIVLNCCDLGKHRCLIEYNVTTFKITGKAYNKLLEIVRENSDELSWWRISIRPGLSEDFIREFQNRVNWYNISFYQNLSENFIREFKNKVNWFWIARKQNLSEEFRKEFQLDQLSFSKESFSQVYENLISMLQ